MDVTEIECLSHPEKSEYQAFNIQNDTVSSIWPTDKQTNKQTNKKEKKRCKYYIIVSHKH